jgi:glutaminyl-peptide cyclotransferase
LSTTSPEQRGQALLSLVEEQVRLGPRVPGSAPHDRLAGMLEQRIRVHTGEAACQEFAVHFEGARLACANILGVFRSNAPGGSRQPPLLIGTHYDTRPRADRETDPARREHPIPGANDGGSGTAVLQHLLPWLADRELDRDVAVAFFDAEDLGDIDGKDFSIGAELCATHPVNGFVPAEVVVLDMVGGADMVFDVDAHGLRHPGSRLLTARIFRLGIDAGWEPFARDKPGKLKCIVSDHYPFLKRGVPSCLLIDIDYPQWHTQADDLAAVSGASLGVTEAAIELFLSRPRG